MKIVLLLCVSLATGAKVIERKEVSSDRKTEEKTKDQTLSQDRFEEGEREERYVDIGQMPKIVGGHDATKGAYPWQIQVLYADINFCGGSIVNDQWILSAAHCYYWYEDASRFTVVAGEHNRLVEEGTEQRFTVEKIIVHENFNPNTRQNDVALIKISGRFKVSEYVQPILLATPDQDAFIDGNQNLFCVVSGWGQTDKSTPISDILQVAATLLEPFQTCKEIIVGQIYDDMLCAGYMVEGIGPCSGDSGAPLACLVDRKWTLVGVASFGLGAGCGSKYPDFYARVTAAYDWIKKNC